MSSVTRRHNLRVSAATGDGEAERLRRLELVASQREPTLAHAEEPLGADGLAAWLFWPVACGGARDQTRSCYCCRQERADPSFPWLRRHHLRCYAAPDSSDDPLRTRTILPVMPHFPSNSCACLASTSGNRCAISGLIFCCLRRSSRAIKSWRNNAGLSRLSHWML